MRNPVALVGGAVALIVTGFRAGLAVGLRRTVEEGRSQTSTQVLLGLSRVADTVASGPAQPRTPASEPPLERLRERVVKLELELRVARDESAKRFRPSRPSIWPAEPSRTRSPSSRE